MDHPIVELVYTAKGDSQKADSLIRDYLPFIKSEASKATEQIITEGSDELSIAMIGFHEAIESYSKIRGTFLKYASVVMKRKLIDYYRKEKRHRHPISLDETLYDDSETLLDKIQDKEETEVYDEIDFRDATRQEIIELSNQLKKFDLSLTDIADSSPKQERTLNSCWRALHYVKENPDIIREVIKTKKLPISQLSAKSGVEKKTLERHRKYLMAMIIIFSNGYEIIRGHLRETAIFRESEVEQ